MKMRRVFDLQILSISKCHKIGLHFYLVLTMKRLSHQTRNSHYEETAVKLPCQGVREYDLEADFSYLENYGFRIIGQLARGTYGVVFAAVSLKKLSEVVAIKVLFSTVNQTLIFSEIAFLKMCESKPNLPKLLTHFTHNCKTHMVTNFVDFEPFIVKFSEISLFISQAYYDNLSLQQIRCYMWELLSALRQLKSLGIIHRDVKPLNFLFNPKTRKGILVDLGLAEIEQGFCENSNAKFTRYEAIYKKIRSLAVELGTNKTGTQIYMPLQSLLKYPEQSYEVDIWAAGLIFYQLLSRRYTIFSSLPFGTDDEPKSKQPFIVSLILSLTTIHGQEAVSKLCERLGYKFELLFEGKSSKEGPIRFNLRESFRVQGQKQESVGQVENLLYRMLELEPRQRISVQQAMSHQFFNIQLNSK